MSDTKSYSTLIAELTAAFGPGFPVGDDDALTWRNHPRDCMVRALDLCRNLDDAIIVSITRWGIGNWQLMCQVEED